MESLVDSCIIVAASRMNVLIWRRRVILEVSSAAAGRVCQAAKMLQAC